MQNKNEHTLIYDDNCPLCAAYTNVFVRTGLLLNNGREKFSDITCAQKINLDLQRAHNEIPLIKKNGEVLYGVDAMLEVLGNRFPLIKKVGKISPVYFVLLKLYKFISFNRKVVVAKIAARGAYNCAPSFNLKYRLLFIGFLCVLSFAFSNIFFRANPFHLASIDNTFLKILLFSYAVLHLSFAIKAGVQKGIELFGQFAMHMLLSSFGLLMLTLCSSTLALFFATSIFGYFIIHSYRSRYHYFRHVITH